MVKPLSKYHDRMRGWFASAAVEAMASRVEGGRGEGRMVVVRGMLEVRIAEKISEDRGLVDIVDCFLKAGEGEVEWEDLDEIFFWVLDYSKLEARMEARICSSKSPESYPKDLLLPMSVPSNIANFLYGRDLRFGYRCHRVCCLRM
jgi:hypothetical protein